MNKRLFIPIILAFVCAGLMAQAEIISITYDGDSAIIYSNTPPDTLVYYWQGTSCGTLMNHSSSSTVATTSGTYYLREYYSTGAVWATTCASTIVMFADETAPVLSNVTAGPINTGTDIMATSNEDGMIYLVPGGTAADIGAITSGQVASATSVASVASTLLTSGLPEGDFIVYAVDGSDNISTPSPAIALSWTTFVDPANADSDQVRLYPANVDDILYIKSNIQVSSAIVYSLQGAQMISINTPIDQIDMSSLNAGIYIVKITLEDNTSFNGKVTKR